MRTRLRAALRPTAIAVLALLAACESVPDPLEIEGVGRVFGQAFLDRNGSGAADAGDRPYRGLTVTLTDLNSGRVAATIVSDSNGVYTFEDVPVGRYRVVVDAGQLGDSVHVTAGADTAVTVALSDSLAPQVTLALAYPLRTVAQVRALPAGRPVLFVARVAGIVGDTAYLWDGTRGIRAPGFFLGAPPSGELAGDSVRVVARTTRLGGQAALDSAILIPLAALPPGAPVPLTSAVAAAAGGGQYDAAPVRIAGATVVDSVTHDGNSWLRVDDGSGVLEVRLGPGIPFALTPYLPGVVMNLSGVLEPLGSGWVLLPRAGSDLEVTDIPSTFRPALPTGLTAAAVDSTVTLSWTDASTNETRFEVERRGGGTLERARVAQPAAGATSYTETVGGNGFYGYRIRACNGLVCSEWTEEVTVSTVPAAPIELAAFARTKAVQLRWRDQSRVEESFEIQRQLPGGEFVTAATIPGDNASYLDVDREPGTEITYRVRACNAAGCSPYSNTASATPIP
ncbi:MAG TPA: SdrD B-like domain-containing protein [Longimicrobium sp.]|nr:SdrD B-like domain-containing protein [Longimicrobium sp.]